MIQTVNRPSRTVNVSNILRARYSKNKVALPVNKHAANYARFKHVRGIAAPSGQGLPLFKLKILDNLIERLSQIKQESMEQPDITGMKPEALDAMIKSLELDLHSSVAMTQSSFGGSGEAV
ncbi:MAG: hypothetical protein ACLFR1_04595, partial [Spirochaetia bacterium]